MLPEMRSPAVAWERPDDPESASGPLSGDACGMSATPVEEESPGGGTNDPSDDGASTVGSMRHGASACGTRNGFLGSDPESLAESS